MNNCLEYQLYSHGSQLIHVFICFLLVLFFQRISFITDLRCSLTADDFHCCVWILNFTCCFERFCYYYIDSFALNYSTSLPYAPSADSSLEASAFDFNLTFILPLDYKCLPIYFLAVFISLRKRR